MIKRTIKDEEASLEVKFESDSGGTLNVVHLHCMKNHETSKWSRTGSTELSQSFELKTCSDSPSLGLVIVCKRCGREWSILHSAGDIGILSGVGLEPSMPYTVEMAGVAVATFTSTHSSLLPLGVAFTMTPVSKNANLAVDLGNRKITIR